MSAWGHGRLVVQVDYHGAFEELDAEVLERIIGNQKIPNTRMGLEALRQRISRYSEIRRVERGDSRVVPVLVTITDVF